MSPESRVLSIGDDISVAPDCQFGVSSMSGGTPQAVFCTDRNGVRVSILGRPDPNFQGHLAFPVPFGTPVRVLQNGEELARVVLRRHLPRDNAVEAEVTH